MHAMTSAASPSRRSLGSVPDGRQALAGAGEPAHLRELLDALPDGVLRFSKVPHRGIDFVNRTFARRTGFTREEYFEDPKLLLGVVHPDDRKIVEELFDRGPDGDPLLVRLIARGGRVEWVELRGAPVADAVGELTAVVVEVRWIPSPEASKRAPTRVFGRLRIEFDRARAVVDGKQVHLTPSELRVLALLTERLGQIVTRKEIMRTLWESAHVGTAAAAESHISALRRKIERNPRQPEHIETVRGRGYRFVG